VKVWVHRNLKHGRKAPPLYSILHNGKVIDRRHRVLLGGATFVVRPSGCTRTRQEKRKNVHAFVVGRLVGEEGAFGIDQDGKDLPVRISYNPFKACAFLDEHGHEVTGARAVLLNERGISAAYLETQR
jgi:hypothetical protein